MEFKIDTKDLFTIIMPLNGPIDAKMAVALQEKCAEMRQSGSKNFIIDMENCDNMDENAVDVLVALHEECYGMEQSLVYTGISKQGIGILKEDESDLLINLAPTMKEAVDIISMEILERDLFSEE
jgi:anti-anti-sigma factor